MRKLMWFTIGFCAACAFGAYCYGGFFLPAAALLMIAALGAAIGSRFWEPMRIAATVLVGVSFGFLWFYGYDSLYLSDARALDGETAEVTAIATGYSYETDYGSAVDGHITLDGKVYRVRIYLNEREKIKPGDRIISSFRFRFTTSGGISDVLYHRSQGIFLLGYQKGNAIVERFWSAPLVSYPAIWREKLTGILERSFPEDAMGFAKALLLGDRTDISYETSTDFKISGISHIIAVSGMHVSILFGAVYFLTGKRRIPTALIGIPAVLLFAAVVGFTPSVTRAAVMQCLMMAALLLDKEYDGPTALSFAALVMLLVNPLCVSSVSFQLSFACMAGICLFSQPMNQWLQERLGKWKFLKKLAPSVCVTLSASVLTTPLAAVHFGAVSLVSVITNLLTLWVISFIFYGVGLVCILGLFSAGAAAFVGAIVSWPVRYVLVTAKVLAAFPLAAVYTQSGYIVAWLVFAYVMLALYMAAKEKHPAAFSGLVGLALCLCIAFSWAEPLLDGCRMTVLDVGQGQAILLQSGGKTFLVDCGGDYDEDAADITAETLLSQGIRRLDGIVLTHYDSDHSGGLPLLLTRIDTQLLLLPHSYDPNGVGDALRETVGEGTVEVMEDMTLTFDGTQLQLFAPVSYNSGNESSMALLFRTENCAILITGDMGASGERLLLKTHDLPQVDVLLVGHHGSTTSTSALLLGAVRPKYAFISVGENSYGHPAQAVLDRLAAWGCIIYRTDEDGTVIFRR